MEYRIKKGADEMENQEEKKRPEETEETNPPEAEKPETGEKEEIDKKEKKKKLSPEKEKLQKLQEEFDQQAQLFLKVRAEYDNFRKRTQKEKDAVYNNAVSDTVQAILPIADNIERALSQENAGAEDMRKGVEMINAQIKAAFEKLGIEETGAVGESFDPNLHNAVAHIDDENLGENVISAVFQKGYLLGGRVVRHAMVQVAN